MRDVFSCWRRCVLWAATTATCVRRRRGRWSSRVCSVHRATTTAHHQTTMTRMTTLPARTAELHWNSPHRVSPTRSMWMLSCCSCVGSYAYCYEHYLLVNWGVIVWVFLRLRFVLVWFLEYYFLHGAGFLKFLCFPCIFLSAVEPFNMFLSLVASNSAVYWPKGLS